MEGESLGSGNLYVTVQRARFGGAPSFVRPEETLFGCDRSTLRCEGISEFVPCTFGKDASRSALPGYCCWC